MSWSVGLAFSLPLFEGFAPIRRASGPEGPSRGRPVRRAGRPAAGRARGLGGPPRRGRGGPDLGECRRSLFEAAQENLDAAQESYRQGLSSMIALVDARTAFTDAERDPDPGGVRPPDRLCGSGSRHRIRDFFWEERQ